MTFLRPISYAPHPVIFGGDHGVSVSGHSANPRGSFWGAVKNTLEMPGTWRMSEHPEKSPEVCVACPRKFEGTPNIGSPRRAMAFGRSPGVQGAVKRLISNKSW